MDLPLLGKLTYYKTNLKPLLVSLNPNPNNPWILVKNKVLIKHKQALGCS